MRLEIPREIERFGAVRFYGLQKVFELDSGLKGDPNPEPGTGIQRIPYEALYQVERNMAIVIPVKSERLKLIEGVLAGIPHQCLTIMVSNSPKEPIDRFSMEKEAMENFFQFVNKKAFIVHQKDINLANAFKKVGYNDILNSKDRIRDGKAAGMIIGIILAWLAGKKYIGFVDADNYFPGAVEEYVREYAAGFVTSQSKYSMVRIAWQSKPKIVESKLFFRKWGRTTENTNNLMNKLISHYTGFETEIIKTGNAGEHAMTMDLALCLDYSDGYSIEPYHIINLIEKFGGLTKSPYPEIMKKSIEVYQIESRNPHLHEAGDEDHINAMSYIAMQTIYHSSICPKELKNEIYEEMINQKFLVMKEKPQKPHCYSALISIDKDQFLNEIKNTSFVQLLGTKSDIKKHKKEELA
jgi:mannosyl-3-phosphoglycerate synthase